MKLATHFTGVILSLLVAPSWATLRGNEGRSLKSGSGDSSPVQLSAGQCEICSENNKNKPDALTFEYVPQGATSQFQGSDHASCVEGTYPSTTTLTMTNKDGLEQSFDVEAGTVFEIKGPFNANTYFHFQQGSSCHIHASCSAPLVAGDQLGPFKLLAGNDCGVNPGEIAEIAVGPGEECEICSKENKNRPSKLTIQYKSTGTNSKYQDISKATCVAGNYASVTTIETVNKDKITQVVSVQEGTVFEIDGPFNAETDFMFAEGGECFIHTSCSVPLVAGDQIGPFLILEGNECVYETPEPSSTPSVSPTIAPTATPSVSPTKTPSTSPSKSPSFSPTSSPSVSPSLSPTTLPTSSPSVAHSGLPSVSPTKTPSSEPSVAHSGLPSVSPTKTPSSAPSIAHSDLPSVSPTTTPSSEPSVAPSKSPSDSPTSTPSDSPTDAPSDSPTDTPSDEPSVAPTVTPCIQVEKVAYDCGEAISVSFAFNDPLEDDWIGIYPCNETIFFHAEVWQWTCPGFPDNCTAPAETGDLVFDSLPSYNSFGPSAWPVAPFNKADGSGVNRCFMAVLLRNDGPSVPPYVDLCQSDSFTITESEEDGCAIRPFSTADSNFQED